MKKIALSVIVAFLLAACGTTSDLDDKTGASVETRGGITPVTADGMDGRALPPELTDPKNILSKRSIYFDYDRYDVKADYKDLVTAHARFLAKNPQFRLLIQGNTDDRGSREYNLALGQKRADSIKNMLTLFGAPEDQVESVSLGKEKPKNSGANESAWAENRRGDLKYPNEN